MIFSALSVVIVTSISTLKTTGYGDIAVDHFSTKIFLIFYVLFSTIFLAVAFGNFLAHLERREEHLLKKNIILNNIDLDEIISRCDPEVFEGNRS